MEEINTINSYFYPKMHKEVTEDIITIVLWFFIDDRKEYNWVAFITSWLISEWKTLFVDTSRYNLTSIYNTYRCYPITP